MRKYPQLFEEGLGSLKEITAKTNIDPTATPIFHKARPVHYALREKIEQDLDRLEKAENNPANPTFRVGYTCSSCAQTRWHSKSLW